MFLQSSVQVMVWECIMKGRKGLLLVFAYPIGWGGEMNLIYYKEQVLDGVLKMFYCQISEKEPGVEFQQDEAASHCSKSTMKWFCQDGIPLFLHLAHSPDLSPIEPVWLKLKKCLKLPHSLLRPIKSIWEELPISDIDKHNEWEGISSFRGKG